MRAIVTVVGKDRVGIIAGVCVALSQANVNVLDISQTILEGFFTMTMLVSLDACAISFAELTDKLDGVAKELGVNIRIQREDIFNAMHRI